MKTEQSTCAGFTMIELLVVSTIILVISSIGVVSYQAANRSSRDGKRRADLEQIRAALEIYRNDCGSYPASITTGSSLTGSGSCAGNTYMEVVPEDPRKSYTPSSDYEYEQDPVNTNLYVLCATLENNLPTTGCTRTCSSNCGATTCNYSVCNP